MVIINAIQISLVMLWTFITVYIIAPFLKHKAAFWFTVHIYAPIVAKLLFVKFDVKGLENIDSQKHYIFMANHRSFFDIPCLFISTKRNLHFIAKEELSRQFLTGYMLKKLQIIFIDRKNAQRSASSLKQAIEMIKNGRNVAIFPEGTRSRTGKLGVFRKGGFKLAIQSQVPIVPVAISNSAIAWPLSNFGFRPTTIRVVFGEPISVENMVDEDAKMLIEKTVEFISTHSVN